MSLLSALNHSPLSTSGLPTPLRLCTPQTDALFEQDRNESARLGIEKAVQGLMVSSHSDHLRPMRHPHLLRVSKIHQEKVPLIAFQYPKQNRFIVIGTCSLRYPTRTSLLHTQSHTSMKYLVCRIPTKYEARHADRYQQLRLAFLPMVQCTAMNPPWGRCFLRHRVVSWQIMCVFVLTTSLQ
jgi:hypothetical protein